MVTWPGIWPGTMILIDNPISLKRESNILNKLIIRRSIIYNKIPEFSTNLIVINKSFYYLHLI